MVTGRSAVGARGDGASAPVLPLNLPSSALVGVIRSPHVRALLAEEQALRLQRTQHRDALRELQTRRDELVRGAASQSDAQKANQIIETLHREKEAHYARLEQLRLEQDAMAEARSALRVCSFECSDLARAVGDAAVLLQAEEKALRRAQASHEDPQKEKVLVEQVERYREQHAARLAEKAAKEAAREAARQQLETLTHSSPGSDRQAEYRDLSQRLSAAQARLDALRRERQAASRTASEPVEKMRQAEWQQREALRVIEDRLAEIRHTALPSLRFTFPPEHRAELIGPQGTTLSQLQRDFGVALCVDGLPNGTGFVIGPAEAMRDCVDAIEMIMAHVERHSERREVAYEASKRRHLVGPRGATIQRLEEQSGARLRLQGDGIVEITGTAGALQRAQALIEALLDNFSTGDMPFEMSKIGTVIGQGGATIERVEKATGVHGIRVDRASSTIHFSGSAQAIRKAKAMYSDLLGTTNATTAAASTDSHHEDTITATLHAEERVVRAVIGRGGAQVRRLEQSTGARISCTGTTITLVGTKTAVEDATRQIEALRRAEARLPVDSRMLTLLTSATVRTSASQPSDADTTKSAGPACCSVLEAVKTAVGCEAVMALRAEGCVVIRGRPVAVQQAAMMLRQLMVRNKPSVVRMPYMDVLRPALLRREDGQSRRLLDQFCAGYSPLLHVELDRDRRLILVSSFDAEEVKAAATELKTLLASLEQDRVRTIKEVPLVKVGQLIGPQGSTIRELQSSTGTEISVVREAAEVQVYHPGGDQVALVEAVDRIRVLLGLDADESDEEDEEGADEGTAPENA